MLQQLSRASAARQALTVAARYTRATAPQMRGFIAPTVSRRADFVQELYLRELKTYKVPAVKESDAVGQVATFAAPKAPKSPEETDLAGSLKEYETLAVEVEGGAVPGADGKVAPPAQEDWLDLSEELADDPPKHH